MDTFRRFLKANFPPGLVDVLRAVSSRYWKSVWGLRIFSRKVRSGLTTKYSLLMELEVWVPFSANWWRYPNLTIENANSYPRLLLKLASTFDDRYCQAPVAVAGENCNSLELAERLGEAFSRHGSDKATRHDYQFVYSDILMQLGVENALDILEIGLGTNSAAMISSMGKQGIPGASLRAFREILPRATLYGADVDRDILFREDRIFTGFVDQLNPESFTCLVDGFKKPSFDLIIDDGLHAVNANIHTMIFARNHLKQGGYFVVEDIAEPALDAWYPIIWLLRNNSCSCGLFKCEKGYLFWLKNESHPAAT